MFLIKLLGGDVDDTEIDEFTPISNYIDELEQQLENIVYTSTNKPNQSLNATMNHRADTQNYKHLSQFIEDKVKSERQKLQKMISDYGEQSIHKKLLDELTPSFTLLSFTEYINLITDYILHNKHDKELVYDIVSYLLLDYTPKNTYDIPYIHWSEKQILKAPGNGIKPIGLLYEDYRKWDTERLQLAKTLPRTKQILVVNDFNWIWYNVLKEQSILSQDSTIDKFTYSDTLLKEFMNHLLFNIAWKLLTTVIVFHKLNSKQKEKLTEILDYIDYIIENNQIKFTFNTYKSYLIPEQLSNQYEPINKIDELTVDKSHIQTILNNNKQTLTKLHTKLELTSDKQTKRTIQSQIKLLTKINKQLSELIKSDTIKFADVVSILVSHELKKPQITDIDIIEFMKNHKLLIKVSIL